MTPSQPAAARGSPDWQDVVRTEHFDLLAAYEDPRLRFAVPKAARLAVRSDGMPDFFLEFVSDRTDPTIEDSLYAMLRVGVEAEHDFAQALPASGSVRAGQALLPLAFGTGTWLRLVFGETHTAMPFAWDGALRARLDARIPLFTARLIYGALAAGGVVVQAAIECEVPAVLPRPAATASFDARAVVQALRAALATREDSIPFAAAVDWLAAAPRALVRLEGEPERPEGLGLALAGRLRHLFGRAAPCPDIADGPHVVLDELPPEAPAMTTWDLRTPFLAAVPVFLRCDPFGFLAGSVQRERVTGFTSVPALPDALRVRRLTIASNLPPRFANCTEIAVRVRVDKAVSASGQTDARSIALYPAPGRSQTVDLHYAKAGSGLPYDTSIKVVGDTAASVGPWVKGPGDYLLVDASGLPAPYIEVRATAALLEAAAIHVALAGVAAGELDAAAPRLAFLCDGVHADTRVTVTARERADPGRVFRLDLPLRFVELDLASFPDLVRGSPRDEAAAATTDEEGHDHG